MVLQSRQEFGNDVDRRPAHHVRNEPPEASGCRGAEGIELRDQNPDYIRIVPNIIREKNASFAVVTLGGEGLLVFDNKGDYEKVPALASKVVDKVGAGDSVFIMASLLARVNTPLKVIGFLANLVAAHEVSQLGHQKSLNRSDLLKHARSILK